MELLSVTLPASSTFPNKYMRLEIFLGILQQIEWNLDWLLGVFSVLFFFFGGVSFS